MIFDFHGRLQKLLRRKADMLSGYQMVSGRPEKSINIHVDFFLELDPGKPYTGPEEGLRPFTHFTRYNVIELKGDKDLLNESRFRYYLGRTLVLENPWNQNTRRGQISLTILCLSKPVKLLKSARYEFVQVTPWKYQCTVNHVPVTIMLLRELQKVKGGDVLAWLQILEPNEQRRHRIWNNVLRQELAGRNQLIDVMMEMDKEGFMTVAEEFRQEGRQVGRQEGLQEGRQEGRQEGLQEGLQKGREEMLKEMIHQGLSDSLILKVSHLSLEQLAELKRKYQQS